MAQKLASFVSFLSLKAAIDNATSNSDDNPPIYAFDEIIKTVGSNTDAINAGADEIQNRLANRYPAVKLKALRLVKHVALKGSPEFRRALTQRSQSVRELTSFRCPPDPLKGDAPWKHVQQAAKEALEALHAAPSAHTQQQQPALGGRIQGFGGDSGRSSIGGNVGYDSGRVGGAMVGFGSDSFSGGAASYSYNGSSASVGRNEFTAGAPLERTISPTSMLDTISNGARSIGDRAFAAISRPQYGLLNEEPEYYSAERSGGGYGDSGLIDRGLGSSINGSNRLAPMTENNTPAAAAAAAAIIGDTTTTTTTAVKQANTLETRLVAKTCTPGGLRAAPTSEELRVFVEGMTPLDGGRVAAALEAKLESGTWQEALRALCAIEAALTRGNSASSGELAVYFQSHPGSIRKARNMPHTSVNQRAAAVLKLIGDDTLPQDTAAVATTAGASIDLLGDDLVLTSNETTIGTSTAHNNVGIDTNADPTDLLAGLDVQAASSTGAAPVPASPDIFGDWATASGGPNPNTLAAAGGGVDLLAGLEDLTLGTTSTTMNTGAGSMPMMQQQPIQGYQFPGGGNSTSALPAYGGDLLGGLSGGGGLSSINMGASLSQPQQQQQQQGMGMSQFGMYSQSLDSGNTGGMGMQPAMHKRGPSFGSGAGAMGHAMRTKSMGSQDLTASAEFASKSGLVSSVAREEVAFDFVGDTIAQLKKK